MLVQDPPDYYISGDSAYLGSPGTLRGKSVYYSGGWSLQGGSDRTWAAGDTVGIIADPSFPIVLVTDLAIPSNGAANNPNIIRGCKTDGTWDDTRATQAAIDQNTSFKLAPNGQNSAHADLALTNAGASTPAYVPGTNGDNSIIYNVSATTSASSTVWAFQNSLFASNHTYVACTANGFGGGFELLHLNVTVAYCRALNTKNIAHSGFYIGNTNTVVTNCLAYNNTGWGFRNNNSHQTYLHCTSDSNGNSGFLTSSGFNNRIFFCISTNNGGYGFETSLANYGALYVGNIGSGNTSGLHNSGVSMIGDAISLNPLYVGGGDFTPTESTIPEFSSFFGSPAGGNVSGILSGSGGGGGGGAGIPIIGGGIIQALRRS